MMCPRMASTSRQRSTGTRTSIRTSSAKHLEVVVMHAVPGRRRRPDVAVLAQRVAPLLRADAERRADGGSPSGSSPPSRGRPNTIQCTNGRGNGASGSSHDTTTSRVPSGSGSKRSGGDLPSLPA